MSDDEKRLLVAHITGIPSEDWKGRSGKKFRATLVRIAKQFLEVFRQNETAQDLAAMAVRRVEGEVSGKYATMVRDFNQAETLKIEAELRRRTLEAEIEQKTAAARKEKAQATIAELDAIERQIQFIQAHAEDAALGELLKTLKRHSVCLEPVGEDVLRLRLVQAFPDQVLDELKERMADGSDDTNIE